MHLTKNFLKKQVGNSIWGFNGHVTDDIT